MTIGDNDLRASTTRKRRFFFGSTNTDMGGSSAAVAVLVSAAGIRNVILGLRREDNGCFYDYTGAEVSW